MAKLKKIIHIEIYDDLSTIIREENINDDSNISIIEDEVNISISWKKYNLISLRKGSEIYNELQKFLPNQDIIIEFNNSAFKGKIDANGAARIYSLANLYKYLDNNGVNVEPGKIAKLQLNPQNKKIKLIIN